MTNYTIIAAMTRQRSILSIDGKMPWHPIVEDMVNFRHHTINKPVIMGRKTYETIGKPLRRRRNIVLSRNPNFYAADVSNVSSVMEAAHCAMDYEEAMIIGGAEIYAAFLPFVTKMRLTFIHKKYEEKGHDIVRFPEWYTSSWVLQDRHVPNTTCCFDTYIRIR